MYIDVSPLGFTSQQLMQRASKLPNPIKLASTPRVVIHHQITPEAVTELVALLRTMADEVAQR